MSLKHLTVFPTHDFFCKNFREISKVADYSVEIQQFVLGLRFYVKLNFDNFESRNTVWKFYKFSITQIFREINFEHSTNAKSGILTHLEALNCYFYDFLHFLNTEICQIDKIQSP